MFSEQVENVLFAHDMLGEFQISRSEEGYSVEVESEELASPPVMIADLLTELLCSPVSVQMIPLGTLRQDGSKIHILQS